MRNIKKGTEPDSLRQHRSTPGADWDGYKGKAEAFAALCREQGSLCAYCMTRIKPYHSGRKIEHWIPRTPAATSPYPVSHHRDNEMKLPKPPKPWTLALLGKELERWRGRSAVIAFHDEHGTRKTCRGFFEYNQVAIAFLEKQIGKRARR